MLNEWKWFGGCVGLLAWFVYDICVALRPLLLISIEFGVLGVGYMCGSNGIYFPISYTIMHLN